MKSKVHPMVEPLRKWLAENERLLDSATLGEPRKYNQYLENRLREAFQAGWNAHISHTPTVNPQQFSTGDK